MKRNTLKKIIGKIHLWLGLSSGVIVFIIGITGSIYVFQQEISSLFYNDILYIEDIPDNRATIPVSVLWEKAQAEAGKYPVIGTTIYKAPDKAWGFLSYQYNAEALTYFGNYEQFKYIYLNPYTGQVTGVVDYEYDFFNIIKFIHWSLLLNTEIGQPIIGWSTMIFLVMTVTGLFLWWPRNRNAINQRFSVRLKAKWRRVVYDLHNVLGFYIILLVLLIAATGLVYAFTWFDSAMYFIATGRTERPASEAVLSDSTKTVQDPLEISLENSKKLFPEWENIYTAGMPAGETDPIYVSVNMVDGTYYKTNTLYYDKNSAELLKGEHYNNLSAGEKFISMNYDIHVGAIGGLPTKIIAFFISLIASSLPVTGFMIWYGRKNRKKKYS